MKTILKLPGEVARYKRYYMGAVFAALCLMLVNLTTPGVCSKAAGLTDAGICKEKLVLAATEGSAVDLLKQGEPEKTVLAASAQNAGDLLIQDEQKYLWKAVIDEDTVWEEVAETGDEFTGTDAYKEFLSGARKAVVSAVFKTETEGAMEWLGLECGEELSVLELADSIAEKQYIAEDDPPFYFRMASYAYYDAGADGVCELAVRFTGLDPYNLSGKDFMVFLFHEEDGTVILDYEYQCGGYVAIDLYRYGFMEVWYGGGMRSWHSELCQTNEREMNTVLTEVNYYEFDPYIAAEILGEEADCFDELDSQPIELTYYEIGDQKALVVHNRDALAWKEEKMVQKLEAECEKRGIGSISEEEAEKMYEKYKKQSGLSEKVLEEEPLTWHCFTVDEERENMRLRNDLALYFNDDYLKNGRNGEPTRAEDIKVLWINREGKHIDFRDEMNMVDFRAFVDELGVIRAMKVLPTGRAKGLYDNCLDGFCAAVLRKAISDCDRFWDVQAWRYGTDEEYQAAVIEFRENNWFCLADLDGEQVDEILCFHGDIDDQVFPEQLQEISNDGKLKIFRFDGFSENTLRFEKTDIWEFFIYDPDWSKKLPWNSFKWYPLIREDVDAFFEERMTPWLHGARSFVQSVKLNASLKSALKGDENPESQKIRFRQIP